MIKSVRVTNKKGETLVLDLSNPFSEGLVVRNIEGIGAVNADINVSDLAFSDGGVYNSARAQKRNIVFTLGIIGAPSVEEARRKTYRFFALKEKVCIQIVTDLNSYYIEGYTESNTPVIFSNDEIITISVICPDPYFRQVNRGTIAHNLSLFDISPEFEFPFASSNAKELIFGSVNRKNQIEVNYEGDVETGFEIRMNFTGTVGDLYLVNATNSQVMVVQSKSVKRLTGKEISSGDELHINTATGQKNLYLQRGGDNHLLLSALTKDSKWLTLSPGLNTFSYDTPSGLKNISTQIEHPTLFQGV